MRDQVAALIRQMQDLERREKRRDSAPEKAGAEGSSLADQFAQAVSSLDLEAFIADYIQVTNKDSAHTKLFIAVLKQRLSPEDFHARTTQVLIQAATGGIDKTDFMRLNAHPCVILMTALWDEAEVTAYKAQVEGALVSVLQERAEALNAGLFLGGIRQGDGMKRFLGKIVVDPAATDHVFIGLMRILAETPIPSSVVAGFTFLTQTLQGESAPDLRYINMILINFYLRLACPILMDALRKTGLEATCLKSLGESLKRLLGLNPYIRDGKDSAPYALPLHYLLGHQQAFVENYVTIGRQLVPFMDLAEYITQRVAEFVDPQPLMDEEEKRQPRERWLHEALKLYLENYQDYKVRLEEQAALQGLRLNVQSQGEDLARAERQVVVSQSSASFWKTSFVVMFPAALVSAALVTASDVRNFGYEEFCLPGPLILGLLILLITLKGRGLICGAKTDEGMRLEVVPEGAALAGTPYSSMP